MMKRKLFFLERVIYGSGETAFNVLLPVKIRGLFPEDNLSHALERLQEKHPFLKAFVKVDEQQVPWFVVEESRFNKIPVRIVARKSDNHWEAEVTSEWANVFDVRSGPLMRMVWVKGEEFSELILVMHHCVCDGRSAMSILADLLLLLDNREVNIGKEKPILSLSDIVPPAVLRNKKRRIKAKVAGSMTSLVLWLMPLKKKELDRKRDYLINWKLDQEVSDNLMRVSKLTGVTVNTLLCKTVLCAFEAVMKDDFQNKIICPVDIRKFVPQLKEENIFAFVSMAVLSADHHLDFISDARRMQADVAKKIASLDPYAMLMQMEESHSSLGNLTNFLKYSKPNSDCLFSNLGKIAMEHRYRSFEVETIYSPSAVGPLGKTTGFVTSTYRGKMDFTFIGSEGFMPYEKALAIKDTLIKILSTMTNATRE